MQFLGSTAENVDLFLKQHPGGFVISPEDRVDEIRKTLPAEYRVLGKTPYFLKDFDLVVLGTPGESRVATEDAAAIRR